MNARLQTMVVVCILVLAVSFPSFAVSGGIISDPERASQLPTVESYTFREPSEPSPVALWLRQTETGSGVAPQSGDNLAKAPETAPDRPRNPDSDGSVRLAVLSAGNDAEPSLSVSLPNNENGVRAVDRSITLFSDRIRERFTIWLERSARYMEIMKDILQEKGLPEEIVFLPIIESGFNPHAYSRARAVGAWQFIEGTAKRYGLVVDWWRDERKDPVKSTIAAAEYLSDLYDMFGCWNLALAAYNAGEGRISRAMKRTAAEDYWSLIRTNQLHSETKEYVPRFIAATMIATTPEEYGFRNLAYHEPLEFDEIEITSPLDIEVIARCAETSVEEIRGLNPEIRRWSTPHNVDKYVIRIPKGSSEFFSDNLEEIAPDERCSYQVYKAKKGDTIQGIARKFSLPVGVLLALNGMGGIERLAPGEVVKLPPAGKYSPDLDDRVAAKKVAKSSSLKKVASSKDRKSAVKTKTKAPASAKTKKDKVRTKRI